MNYLLASPTRSDVSVSQMVSRLVRESQPGPMGNRFAEPVVGSPEVQKVGRAIRTPHPMLVTGGSPTPPQVTYKPDR